MYIIVNPNPSTSHFSSRLTHLIPLSLTQLLKSTHKSTLSLTLNLTTHTLTLKHRRGTAQALCLSPLVPFPTVTTTLFSTILSPLDATTSHREPSTEVAPSLSLTQ